MLWGRPLVAWALDAATSADLHPILLVVGRGGSDVIAAAPPGVIAIRARNWRHGIAHSMRAALEALEPYVQVDAVCIGLADQPLVTAEAYRRLAEAHAGGATLAAASYGGQRANPVLVDRSLWAEAHGLSGDVGARGLMEHHDVVDVDCTDVGDPTDVDTLDELRALEASGSRPGVARPQPRQPDTQQGKSDADH